MEQERTRKSKRNRKPKKEGLKSLFGFNETGTFHLVAYSLISEELLVQSNAVGADQEICQQGVGKPKPIDLGSG